MKVGKTDEDQKNLRREAFVLSQLQECPCKRYSGVPKLIDFHCERDNNYIIMEAVGRSLDSLSASQPFSPLKVAMLGMKLVSALEALHAAGFVHRDIKPDNLATAKDPRNSDMFLLDLGLADKYRLCGCHVKYSEDVSFAGNYVFCSCNVLNGVKATRRDDLESLAYVLIFLRMGTLPWIQLASDEIQTATKHYQRKMELSPAQLCAGIEVEYQQFVTYCRGLRFDENPNYNYMKGLFQVLAYKLGFVGVWEYPWVPSTRIPKKENSSLEISMHRLNANFPSPGERLKDHTESSPSPAPALTPLPRFPPRSAILSRKTVQTCGLKQSQLDTQTSEALTPLLATPLNIDKVRRKLKEETSM